MVERRSLFFRLLHPLFVYCVYLFLYIPIVIVILFSFNNSRISVGWVGFTLRWYQELFTHPALLVSLRVSLIVATVSTVLSVAMGTAFVFATKWWRLRLWNTLFYANILFPEIILAIGVLSVFSLFRISIGYTSLIVGHTLLGLGFVVPIVRARFTELDPLLTEASADLGASELQTFGRIILPLLFPSLIASGLLVFTLSLDDFLVAFFCSSSSVQTLSVYVFSLVREGINPSINAISTCLLAVSSLLILLLCYLKVIDRIITHE